MRIGARPLASRFTGSVQPFVPHYDAMHLVQLFLPLYDNTGTPFPKAGFDAVRAELADRFGGVTAFVRSPAVGLWEDDGGAVQRDEVVLLEVMDEDLDPGWWAGYRH